MPHPKPPRSRSLAYLLAGALFGIATAMVAISLVLPDRAGAWGTLSNITFTPQVEIPGSGLPAQEPKTIDSPETFLGGVIVGVYRYGVWLTITAAIFATMLGGLLWLLAGGNASRVDTAKRLIGSSLFGLVLAFTSYLVLQGINPRLLELKLPVLPKVQREEATLICCKDPVVGDNPPTYHSEKDVSAEGSTETKCRDGSDAVSGPEISACASTCCVCIVSGMFDSVTGVRAFCYAGAGLTEEWCKSSAGKPELSSDGVTETSCRSYNGNCAKVAEDIRANTDTPYWKSVVDPVSSFNFALDRIRDSFSCKRTFNRTQ